MLAARGQVVVGGLLQIAGCGGVPNGWDVGPVDRVGACGFGGALPGDGLEVGDLVGF